MGQSPPGETYNETGEGLPFYQGISDFGFRFPSRRVYCTAPTRFAEEGDVLLSVRAPVGSLNMAEERCAIGRGVAALRLKGKQQGYLYYLLKKHAFRFVRSVSKSARSLVIRIPADLAKHLDINEDSKIEMIPLGKKRFVVEVK